MLTEETKRRQIAAGQVIQARIIRELGIKKNDVSPEIVIKLLGINEILETVGQTAIHVTEKHLLTDIDLMKILRIIVEEGETFLLKEAANKNTMQK